MRHRMHTVPGFVYGLTRFAVGFAKKLLLANPMGSIADACFGTHPDTLAFSTAWLGLLAYAFQISFDFSAYSDMAIGLARLLGFHFCENFDSPYTSASLTEFWRRWHMSLSSFLRDYLYIPLGGNRKGRGRTYFNLLATMVLGGLWHGAAWTFVAWGTLHGLALALNKWWSEAVARGEPPRPSPPEVTGLARCLKVLLTFHFVAASWVFFRADSFDKAWLMFQRLGSLTLSHDNLPSTTLAVLALGFLGHFVPEAWFGRGQRRFVALPGLAQGVLLFLVAIALRRMASADAVPFVYFQF